MFFLNLAIEPDQLTTSLLETVEIAEEKLRLIYPQVFAGVWTASAFKVWQTLQGMQRQEK